MRTDADTVLAPIYSQPRPTIALCMIVRDEAAVIGRCIESVRSLIDCWQICDTGSRDQTREIVAARLADVPGELHERPWRDFGWNRSELMTLAAGAADYLLLLDADMTLKLLGPLPPLQADAFLLRHEGEVSYAVPRLVRGDRPWRFEGSTHEYLACDGPYQQELLDALTVEHWSDGGSRIEKFQRDARLLEADLEREPDNARATFYLAQTHRDLGNPQRALELYRRRAGLGGWDEEVFYATYQAGVLLAARDDDAAIPTLLLAWQQRRQRAEPLYELVRVLRYRRRYRAAYALARQAVELDRPDDLLFVHRSIYDWGLRFELAVAAYWVGDINRALELNQALLTDGHAPPDVEAAVQDNYAYCVADPALPASSKYGRTRCERAVTGPRGGVSALKDLCPSMELRTLQLNVPLAWPNFNPSIAADGDGFRLIVRTANYRLIDGRYHFLTNERVVRTVNYMVRLDRDLEIVAAAPLADVLNGPRTYPTWIRGYEDCRLVSVGDAWFATATVRDHSSDQRCEMVLLAFAENAITSVKRLSGILPVRDEKNWMPFCAAGSLNVVYSCDPTVVLRIEPSTGVLGEINRAPGPPGAANFRGGSQGIETADGLLFVVHEVAPSARGRVYSHRFILLDTGHSIAGVSAPFHLAGEDVEFCAGLARRDGELLLTFGGGDRAARLAILDADEVIESLVPVLR